MRGRCARKTAPHPPHARAAQFCSDDSVTKQFGHMEHTQVGPRRHRGPYGLGGDPTVVAFPRRCVGSVLACSRAMLAVSDDVAQAAAGSRDGGGGKKRQRDRSDRDRAAECAKAKAKRAQAKLDRTTEQAQIAALKMEVADLERQLALAQAANGRLESQLAQAQAASDRLENLLYGLDHD